MTPPSAGAVALSLASVGVLYDLLYVRSLDCAEHCEHGRAANGWRLAAGGWRLLETGASWLPPDAWCRFERRSLSATPFWAPVLFYDLLTVVAWAATGPVRLVRPHPYPGLGWRQPGPGPG
ncbi:hypothetical protein AB0D10_24055 [Kitasatospora sp. NPDC048545]|uniref:hypothetical protein n=1 Tax=Kitasatospora sp. NPDC048545 TaxID=3157208 RepID=UPI0033C3F75E